MILPSITTLILGAVFVAALAVLDWYVWGMTPVRRYPLSPEERGSLRTTKLPLSERSPSGKQAA